MSTGTRFLSTLSLRRATQIWINVATLADDFYPRSPCGERPAQTAKNTSIAGHFYPRSPCGERPVCMAQECETFPYFYPRSPCGERQRRASEAVPARYISIHALLAESDTLKRLKKPCTTLFLSTLSLRRATYRTRSDIVKAVISIHALLAESDGIGFATNIIQADFYPRSPCGERQ